MKYIALDTFVGIISAKKGDFLLLDEKEQITKDLIRGKLIEQLKEKKVEKGGK